MLKTGLKQLLEVCGAPWIDDDELAGRLNALGLHLLSTVHALYPEKLAWNPHFDRLVGTDRVREQISEGKPVEEIIASWKTEEARFENLRQKYLLY